MIETLSAGGGEADAGNVEAQLRAHAVADWRGLHDPMGQRDADALDEAASIAELVVDDHGTHFEPVMFGELVAFIEAMPF